MTNLVKPGLQGAKSAATKDDKQIEYMVQEIHALDVQIHEYLRLTSQSINLTLVAAGAAALIISSDHSTIVLSRVVLLVLPLIMVTIALYNLNVAAEAAALGVQRDWLSERVNKALGGKPVFVADVVAGLRQGTWGTGAAYVLAGSIVVTTIGTGLYYNVWSISGGWFWFNAQLLSTGLTVVAFCIVLAEFMFTRKKIREGLDKVQ